MPRHVQKNMELKEAERHTLTSVETRHAGNLRLAAVLLHPLLRNEAISQHRAAGKETAQMADSPLMDAGFSGFLSSKIGPSFLLAFPLLSFTARFASDTLPLPTLLRISSSAFSSYLQRPKKPHGTGTPRHHPRQCVMALFGSVRTFRFRIIGPAMPSL